MHIVIYDHSDNPLVLEHVTRIDEELEGDMVILYDEVDGRVEVQADEIEKFEGGTEV